MTKLVPIRCPQCNKRYRLPASFKDKQVVCKRCQHQFLVADPNQRADSDTAQRPVVGSIFDALNVDDLLNAPSSGLERSKLRRPDKTKNQNKQHAHPQGLSPQDLPPDQQPAEKTGRKQQPKQKQKRRRKLTVAEAPSVDPDPGLIEQELAFAWAKKKKQHKESQTDNHASSSNEDSNRLAGPNTPELDDVELAIYAAVTRQNRRRNILGAIIALIAGFCIGGYFANEEYENLQTPLDAAERDWLTDRGFVLKANRIANVNHDDGATVLVAAGKSFADIDKFSNRDVGIQNNPFFDGERLGIDGRPIARDDGVQKPWAPNPLQRKPFGNRTGRKKEPMPPVDFDTQIDPSQRKSKLITATHSIRFAGPAVAAFSPRGHCYVAGRQYIKAISVKGETIDQRTLELPSGRATAIVATADGRRVILGGEMGLVQSYQLDAQGRLSNGWALRRVHRDKIIQLRASDDSKMLVVYSADGRVTIWDLESQSIELNVSDLVPEPRLQSLQWIDDALLIGSGEGMRKIRSGQSTVELEIFDKRYRLLAADRTGEQIIFCDDQRMGVLNSATKQISWSGSNRIVGQPQVSFSPDSETAFYFDGGSSVLHFDISTGRVLNRFGNRGLDEIRGLAVSFNGKTLLVEGANNLLYLHSVPGVKAIPAPALKAPLASPVRNYPPPVVGDGGELTLVANVKVTSEKISAMCLSDNGFLIAAANAGRLMVYDWTAERMVSERFETGQDPIKYMTTVANRVFMGRESGMIDITEIETDGKLGASRKVAGHVEPIICIAAIPDSPYVVSVTSAGHTRVWDSDSGDKVYDGRPLEPRIQSVAIDRRSDVLLADGDELATLDYKSGTVRKKKGDVRVRNVTLLPDGKRLGFFDRGKLNLATTSRGEINLSIDLPTGAKSVSFSPDSKLAFVFTGDKAIVYRLRGGKELLSLELETRNSDTKMIFSADEKFMTPFYPGASGSFKIYATPRP